MASLIAWMVMLCSAGYASAQVAATDVDLDSACSDHTRHGFFVEASLRLVENGADKDAVLRVLACIAVNGDKRTQIGYPAVRALFHIAEDDKRICDLLQGILDKPGTLSVGLSSVYELLVYVANADTRRAMLDVVRQDWPSTKAHSALEALADLGDEALLPWIDQTVRDLPQDGIRRRYFDRIRRMVEVQRSVPAMLAYIEGDDAAIDRLWIIRQAMRHGASRKDVRKAAMAYLRRSDPQSAGYQRAMTVHGCYYASVFTPEDAQELDVIRRTREVTTSAEPAWPRWATLPNTKRKEFYRVSP